MARQRDIHDHYFREAKRQGFAARSAYKLLEIQDKKSIVRRGDWVLDLGCAPGGWLQVILKHLGPRTSGGKVVGIDLQPTQTHNKFWDDRIITVVGDAFEMSPDKLRSYLGESIKTRYYNVVLSDMMAATTGHHSSDHYASIRLAERALELTPSLLNTQGSFVVKVFEGEVYPDFVSQCKSMFDKVKGFKPKASRNESREMYVICKGFNSPCVPVDSADNVL